MSCAKTAEPIEMPFGMWTWVGLRKRVLDGVHIGATWEIQLNRPCVAAMRPYVKLLCSLVLLGRIAVPYMYLDAAYCYRPSSVVCQSVTLVSLSLIHI